LTFIAVAENFDIIFSNKMFCISLKKIIEKALIFFFNFTVYMNLSFMQIDWFVIEVGKSWILFWIEVRRKRSFRDFFFANVYERFNSKLIK